MLVSRKGYELFIKLRPRWGDSNQGHVVTYPFFGDLARVPDMQKVVLVDIALSLLVVSNAVLAGSSKLDVFSDCVE